MAADADGLFVDGTVQQIHVWDEKCGHGQNPQRMRRGAAIDPRERDLSRVSGRNHVAVVRCCDNLAAAGVVSVKKTES